MSQATPCTTTPASHTIQITPEQLHALTQDGARAEFVGNLLIDKTTGEIIGDIVANYTQAPASHEQLHPSRYVAPDECRSVDEWNGFLEQHIDRRELPPHTTTALKDEQNAALGERFRSGGDYRISKPMMELLLQLHPLVLYRNVIIMTQSDLAKRLNVAESNLIGKLNKLVTAGYLKVFTSRQGDMRKGEIKLLIHPRLIFRGKDFRKGSAVNTWYQDLIRRQQDQHPEEMKVAA